MIKEKAETALADAISENPNWDKFATDLTALSNSYGIGLEGARAYHMEGDDSLFRYTIADSGAVERA